MKSWSVRVTESPPVVAHRHAGHPRGGQWPLPATKACTDRLLQHGRWHPQTGCPGATGRTCHRFPDQLLLPTNSRCEPSRPTCVGLIQPVTAVRAATSWTKRQPAVRKSPKLPLHQKSLLFRFLFLNVAAKVHYTSSCPIAPLQDTHQRTQHWQQKPESMVGDISKGSTTADNILRNILQLYWRCICTKGSCYLLLLETWRKHCLREGCFKLQLLQKL